MGHYDIFTFSEDNSSALSIQALNLTDLTIEKEIPVGIKLPENKSTIITLASASGKKPFG